jgi:predicted ATPase
MLIAFKVGNFRSFQEEQTFSFSTTADSAHAGTNCLRTGIRAVPRVSKVAAVFGPNGSGKSNLIAAFAAMRDLVLNSGTQTPAQFAERYTPFEMKTDASRSTQFEVDVLLDRVRYRYAFSYDRTHIRHEKLLVYQTGKAQRWFERRSADSDAATEWLPFSPCFSGPRVMWRKATRATGLFLTTASRLNAQQLQPLVRWFEQGMEFSSSTDAAAPGGYKPAPNARSKAYQTQLASFLRSADLRIDDVRIVARPAVPGPPTDLWPGTGRAQGGAEHDIEFLHTREDGSAFWLRAADEAAGTRRLVSLFGPFFEALERGKLLLIDDFDYNLHPFMATYLIKLFNDPAVSGSGAQLILTSHNTTLMDLSILRRDEIWLMQLNASNASGLATIAKAHPRKHELVGKVYLRGRYGALPNLRPLNGAAPPAQASAVGADEANLAA